MLDFEQKRKVKSFMYNRWTIGILVVISLFVVHSTWQVYQKQRESEFLRSVSEKKVLELEERNKEINSEIQALDTDQGLEREIRSKFNVVKEQENMAVILDDSDKTQKSSTTPLSFWQKIINFFK